MDAIQHTGKGGFGAVLRNLGWLLAGKGVGALLSLVYLALAARTLGPSGFGQFTLILGTGQATATLVGFESWQIVVRHGMAHLGRGGEAALARLVAFCTALDLAAAAVGCVVATLFVLLLGPVLGWSPRLSHAALAFCIVMLLSVRSTAVGVLRLFDRFGVGAAADATTPILRCIGALVVVSLHGGVRGFLAAWAVAELGTALSYWILARRVAAPAMSLPRLRGAWLAPAEHPGLWRFTWTTNLVSTLNGGARQISMLLVGIAAGAVAAGDYRLAFQLSQSVLRVSDMAARAMFAEVTRAHVGQGPLGLQQLTRRLTRLALAAAGAVVLVLLLGRPALRLIAGTGHAGAWLPLQLLGTAAAIDLAAVGFEPILLATGRIGQAMRLQILGTLCLAAATAILLPAFGAVGMAEATLFASICTAALFGHAALRAVRITRPPC